MGTTLLNLASSQPTDQQQTGKKCCLGLQACAIPTEGGLGPLVTAELRKAIRAAFCTLLISSSSSSSDSPELPQVMGIPHPREIVCPLS